MASSPSLSSMENIIAKEAATAVATAGSSRVKEILSNWYQEKLSIKSMRHWSAFCDKKKFSLPKITEILTRLKGNVVYFQTNYIAVFLLLLLYCVITNLWFLLSIGVCGGLWFYVFYVRAEPIKILNHEVTSREKTIFISAVAIILFYFAGVTSSIYWLGAITITVTLLHALFHIPQEENDFDFNTSFSEGQTTSAV